MSLCWCEKCGGIIWGEACSCKPFQVVDEEGEEYEVFAESEQGAAEKFAEETNVANDYYLTNEAEVEITVNGSLYLIGAATEIVYSAIKQKKPNDSI